MAGEYKSIPVTPELLRFWEDRNHYWHPVDANVEDKYKHHIDEPIPEWVAIRRKENKRVNGNE